MSKFPKYGCVMPFHHMAIRPDGRIFPCCVFRQEESPDVKKFQMTNIFMDADIATKKKTLAVGVCVLI